MINVTRRSYQGWRRVVKAAPTCRRVVGSLVVEYSIGVVRHDVGGLASDLRLDLHRISFVRAPQGAVPVLDKEA